MNHSGMRIGVQGLFAYSIVFLIGITFLISCSNPPEHDNSFHPIPEFEEQESTFLCWNTKFEDTILRLTTVLSKQDHVTVFYNENKHNPDIIKGKLADRKTKIKNVSLIPFKLERDNVWIRDYGPVFMQDHDGNTRIFSFEYPHEVNIEYNQFAEQYATRYQLPFLRSKIFSAGGGREINGKGTIILIEGHEKLINPNLSKKEIEDEYRQKFNQTNVIWLKKGIPQDDLFDNGPILDNIYGNGVNWHIDEFCRFADAETILLAKVDSSDMVRDDLYKLINDRLEESYEILKNSRDQDGNPFKIVRIPQAPVIFESGQYKGEEIFYTPITSYLNFVLTNHSVVMPSYYRIGDPEYIKEKDNQARIALQSVFKNKKVVKINSLELNYSGGGLHCITSHKPKVNRYKRIFSNRKRKLG
jgi:agmatine deiminase